MKRTLFLAGLLFSPALFAQATFLPPAASASAVEAVNFAGTEVGQMFRERFILKTSFDGVQSVGKSGRPWFSGD